MSIPPLPQKTLAVELFVSSVSVKRSWDACWAREHVESSHHSQRWHVPSSHSYSLLAFAVFLRERLKVVPPRKICVGLILSLDSLSWFSLDSLNVSGRWAPVQMIARRSLTCLLGRTPGSLLCLFSFFSRGPGGEVSGSCLFINVASFCFELLHTGPIAKFLSSILQWFVLNNSVYY